MRILDICKIDNIEDSKTVESFISKNYRSLINELRKRIELMTEHIIEDKTVYERADFISLKVAPYKNIHVVVLLYKPDYLFSEVRKADITKLRKWLEGELFQTMKIIQETTQSSAIPNHAAKHVKVEPPEALTKLKAPVPTQPTKPKQKPLITFEKKAPENAE